MLYMLHTILIFIFYRKKPTGCFLTTFLTIDSQQDSDENGMDNRPKLYKKIYKNSQTEK